MSTHSVSIYFVQSANPTSATGTRARPLAVEARKAMIIEATMPLLVDFGLDLTSKQIAEAAGVAEGTIFRAFGDKETLIEQTVKKFLDPEPLRRELRSIPIDLPLDDKVLRMIELMRKRFSDVFRVMAAIRTVQPPPHNEKNAFAEFVSEALVPHVKELNWPPDRTAQVIRLVSFAASITHFNAGMEFSSEELTRIVLYGIAGKPATKSAKTSSATIESQV